MPKVRPRSKTNDNKIEHITVVFLLLSDYYTKLKSDRKLYRLGEAEVYPKIVGKIFFFFFLYTSNRI